MSECRWNCVQDINGLYMHQERDWKPSDGHTGRGFALAEFRDTYGQACSVQESSNIYPRLWVGVNCCRMHLSPAQARGLAERLIAFADAEEGSADEDDDE